MTRPPPFGLPRAGPASSLAALLLLALPLGGCDWQTFKSSVAGSCAVFERPPYVVRGQTPYDQDVADNFVESGVAACNWQRPAPRPPELDAVPAAKKAALPAKKRGVIRRIRDRVISSVKAATPPAAASIAPLPAPPPVVAVEPPAPAPPRSAIDELLDPREMAGRRVGP